MKKIELFFKKCNIIRDSFIGSLSVLVFLLLIILSSFAALAQNAITRNGSFTSSSTEFIDRYGHKSSTPSLTKNGAIFVPIPVALCDLSHTTTVVEILSITGKIWMDRNLGASQVATSAIDNLAYGCLYQWGRGNDGHASIRRTSSTTATAVNGSTTTQATSDDPGNALFITSTTSPNDWRNYSSPSTRWQGVSGVNNPCPSGYRLPTDAEFTAEKDANGISSNATAYSSIFKFVVPGWRSGSGTTITGVGSMAFYWSSTSGNYKNAIILGFDAGNQAYSRSFGASVRCIKN